LKVSLVTEESGSITKAMRSSRQAIAKSAPRIVIGNLAVVIVGAIVSLILWALLKWVRSYEWNIGLAALSILLQQAIVLVLCLMQVIRINYNHIIIKRGVDDVVGGNQLGGV
jgi:hypothetical protein